MPRLKFHATLGQDLAMLAPRLVFFLQRRATAQPYGEVKEFCRHYLRKHKASDAVFTQWLYKLEEQNLILITTKYGKLYIESFYRKDQTLPAATISKPTNKLNLNNPMQRELYDSLMSKMGGKPFKTIPVVIDSEDDNA